MAENTRFSSEPVLEAQAINEAERRASVNSVLASHVFAKSPRLRALLEYLTEEVLAGRGGELSAKSIGFHLYQREPEDDANSSNYVRVEARRLRRFLDDYYENGGQSDPVRIHIDKGGYVPRFEQRSPSEDEPKDGSAHTPATGAASRRWGVWLAAPALVGALVLGLWLVALRSADEGALDKTARTERQAMMEQSPASLEAANMTLQARGLIYPIFDAQRQKLTTELFRAAIDIDPNSATAYAGAAQTLGSLALLRISGDSHDHLLNEARQMRDRALELDPGDEWVQSAAGWVAFVERDYEAAMRYSERALSLAPENGNVLDFYGVVAVASGEFEKGVEAGNRERPRNGENTRFAYLNILGAAHFHLREFENAVDAFEEGNSSGGPLSALGVVYLAASYSALGRDAEGRRLVELMQESWPKFPVAAFLTRLHRKQEPVKMLLDSLKAVGWNG